MNNISNVLHLSVFNCGISVKLNCFDLSEMIKLVYGAMITSHADNTQLSYVINKNKTSNEISILREGGPEYITSDIGEFIFLFEKDMTIELQKLRSDLLFIHSAVLEYKGQGLLLVAPSGTGKSTTSWAMLNSGFNYLSDELAPINIENMQVEAYPHALCLKAVPPLFDLPDSCLHTPSTIHVAVNTMPNQAKLNSVKLNYIFYLEFDAQITNPIITPVTTAQASAQLFANSLNILAHDKGESGLEAAIEVAKKVENYSLKSNHLDKTCLFIKRLLDS